MARIDEAGSCATQVAAGIGEGPSAVEVNEAGAESYEEQHVHSVYESIASHFSATRYKPWPVVATFLNSLPDGSVGLDVGCGNGKYLGVNPNVYILGSDRSPSLVSIARDHGGERKTDVAVADGLSLPYRDGAVDFAICIAVIHHLSTDERRIEAIKALLDCVRDGGKILVFVWALEQGQSRRAFDESTTDQDLLVPWVKKAKVEKGGKPADGASDTTYQRYYHLFRKGELEEDVTAAGGKVLDHGYDRDNWWVIASHGEAFVRYQIPK